MEQLNSKLVVNPEIWDAKTGRAIGRSAKVLELNSRLNDIQVILKEHYYDIQRRHGYVTAEMVRNAYMGGQARGSSTATPSGYSTPLLSNPQTPHADER